MPVEQRTGKRASTDALRRWLAAGFLAGVLGSVQAADPPRDPWRDPDWQDAMHELDRAGIRALRFTEALYGEVRDQPRAHSSRDAWFEFDSGGRLLRLEQTRMQDYGPQRRQRFRYVYGSADRLERIEDEDAGTLVFQQRFDSAGRLAEIAERQGVLLVRTRIEYDPAGREIERLTDDGQGKSARREQRRYRADGTPASLEQKAYGMAGASRTVRFDTQGRPRQVVVQDGFDRSTTEIEYPDALTAVWRTRGVRATRERIGPYRTDVTFTVRRAEESLRSEPPEQPVVRSERDERGRRETRTEFDAAGRPLRMRHYDGEGKLICVEAAVPDGEPAPGAAAREPVCGGSSPLAVTIERNERGHWSRQVFEARLPDGRQRLLAEKTRRVEYR